MTTKEWNEIYPLPEENSAISFIYNNLYVTKDGETESVHDTISSVVDVMIEFAAYHVAKVITTITEGVHSDRKYDGIALRLEETISNSYPLENIK